ncbi:haloacid dehalogenase [Mycena filopes]|nr:haloacid dehalogenase [Mycena filopes]
MSPLPEVQALLFDVFGTVVDSRGSVTRELAVLGKQHDIDGDWDEFFTTWRQGYMENARRVAQGGAGILNVDALHREILETILETPQWKALGEKMTKEARDELNLVWHRLDGWPDSTPGLYALKKHGIIATLSNANVRLLIDMAKHADLPWDAVFCSELFGSFKPDPKVYLGAIKHLSLEPHQCVMVAAHVYDLRAAAGLGMRTVYIPRAREEAAGERKVRTKAEGGEVDLVVRSFTELAELLSG